MSEPVLHVVGIGADGWSGLPERLREVVGSSDVVVGGERHLCMVPPQIDAERQVWPSPLRPGLRTLLESWRGRRVAVLASGDPLVAGIATTLAQVCAEVVPDARLTVDPAISSVALARARMLWPAEQVTVLRDHAELPRHLAPGARVLVLSTDEAVPATVAAQVREAGYPASTLTVLADLGAPTEQRLQSTARDWDASHPRVRPLHVLAVEVTGSAEGLGWTPGLPDDAYAHDGQITRRDLRASALARLAPTPGQLLWDIGAGAGSVGIEWMRAHASCRTVAIEVDPARAERIGANAVRLGVPALRVVTTRAPAGLADLPDPDAVFVGGGCTAPGLLDAVWDRLRTGGRLVVHAVTHQTEAMLHDWAAQHGGELTRLSMETAAPIGRFSGWQPARAVVQWAVTR